MIDSHTLEGVELGKAWILLGFADKEQGQLAESQEFLEKGAQFFSRMPSEAETYAAALHHLGGLYQAQGQEKAAADVWSKALAVFERTGNHAGVARTCTNLAGIAADRHDFRKADSYLKRAGTESKLTSDLKTDDSANLAGTRAWLAIQERHFSEAVAEAERALDLCKEAYGGEHPQTGWAYLLVGAAQANAGQIEEAVANTRKGVEITARTLGEQNPRYFAAELVYARVLAVSGERNEADHLKKDAEGSLRDFYRQQCTGCTIGVQALR